MEARDLVINLYRESPVRFLTATEARRHLATVTPYLIGKEFQFQSFLAMKLTTQHVLY